MPVRTLTRATQEPVEVRLELERFTRWVFQPSPVGLEGREQLRGKTQSEQQRLQPIVTADGASDFVQTIKDESAPGFTFVDLLRRVERNPTRRTTAIWEHQHELTLGDRRVLLCHLARPIQYRGRRRTCTTARTASRPGNT